MELLARPEAVQLALRFPEEGRRTDELDPAIDSIRARWGSTALRRASLIDHRGALPVLTRPTALDS